MIKLDNHQIEAIREIKNGSVLCGGVGSGKSRTSLAYYYISACNGTLCINGKGKTTPMKNPKDLYIITTAKKRDSLEWEEECIPFLIFKNEKSINDVKLTVDSWNNIKKYIDIKNAFFIFDEQRVVGYGSWSKAFIKIARNNNWILLSATPADNWSDYIPLFIANGFYRNKSEFTNRHVIYSRYSKYPKIDKYLDEQRLRNLERQILVNMKDNRDTHRNYISIDCEYDREKYLKVFRDRWNIYENEPIQEISETLYLTRRVVNSDPSRLKAIDNIFKEHKKLIIFYNFNYERDMLREYLEKRKIKYSEWNGDKHETIPNNNEWVYIVQYISGCEGWNCITTNTIIFFSQSYSFRQTEQARGRIDRMNTPYKELYYYTLISKAPIDRGISIALKNKKNFNERKFFDKLYLRKNMTV